MLVNPKLGVSQIGCGVSYIKTKKDGLTVENWTSPFY